MQEASEIVESLMLEKLGSKRKSQFSIWESNNKETAELFWETIELASQVGCEASMVIRKFKADYDGPPGSLPSIRRVIRDRSEIEREGNSPKHTD